MKKRFTEEQIIGFTSTFAIAYALLWRPLPYPDHDRLVAVSLYSKRMATELGWPAPMLVNAGLERFEAFASYKLSDVLVALSPDMTRYDGPPSVNSTRDSACLFSLASSRRTPSNETLSSSDEISHLCPSLRIRVAPLSCTIAPFARILRFLANSTSTPNSDRQEATRY